jgi:hypothetical protein
MTSGSSSSGGSSAGRELAIPDGTELCLNTPGRSLLGGNPLFAYRSILRLDPTSVPLADEAAVPVAAWLSYALQTDAAGTEIHSEMSGGEGEARVELDLVPSSLFFLEDAAGWETAVYVDNPSASTAIGDRLLIQAAYLTGATEFSVGPVEQLDRELRLEVISFAPSPTGASIVLRSTASPCVLTDTAADRIDFTLSDGTVSFHTRPAFWRRFDGFTVLAEGEIDGIPFEVDDYWNLEYATGDMGSSMYGVSPLLAARFPETSDGACIVVLEPDPMQIELVYTGRLLDCDQNHLRDLAVESFEVFEGAGDPRW